MFELLNGDTYHVLFGFCASKMTAKDSSSKSFID